MTMSYMTMLLGSCCSIVPLSHHNHLVTYSFFFYLVMTTFYLISEIYDGLL